MKKLTFLPVILLALLVANALPALADNDWKHLGDKSAHRGVDRDEIRVGADEGQFRKIKLEVRHSTVTIEKLVIHYADGTEQAVPMRRKIPAGGQSRPIDLEGNSRVIQKVVFWYSTKKMRKQDNQAVVHLLGKR